MADRYITLCACGSPLIWTFAFPKKEYYCLDCGRLYEMFDSHDSVPETPELAALLERFKREFEQNASSKLIVPRSYRNDCRQCIDHLGYHSDHASNAEREADAEARRWLKERIAAT